MNEYLYYRCLKALLESMETLKRSMLDTGTESYEQGKRDGAKETAQFVIDAINEYLGGE